MAEEAIIQKVIAGGSPTGAPILEAGNSVVLSHTTSGFTVYEVTSGRSFKVRTLTLTNERVSLGVVTFYDCTSDANASNRLLKAIVGAEKSDIIEPTDLLGVREVVSSLIAFTTVSGLFVHGGGFEY